MLIIVEGIAHCFVLLIVCVVGLRNGPERFVAFYGKDVQKRVVELGYTTEKEIKRSMALSGIALFVPMLVLVPLAVYSLNGVTGFMDAFWQITAVYMIGGLFDRIFIDWYWVGYTKAWFIPGTEDLMPYITRKDFAMKWIGTIVGFPLVAACIAGLVAFLSK